mgnify:CR=1 FL=1
MKNQKYHNTAIYTFLIVAMIGFIDSVYLATAYHSGTPLSCKFLSGCNEVARSKYSYIGGVSLPVLGVLFYTIVAINSLLYLAKRSNIYAIILLLVTDLGLLASIYFVYLQVYVIGAICLYCIISATASLILFLLSLYLFLKKSINIIYTHTLDNQLK